MNRAIIVIFHQPVPNFGDHFYTHFEIFYKTLSKWLNLVNQVYIVDSNWGFEENKHPLNSNKIKVIKAGSDSHWGHLNKLIKEIKEEEILIMDSDTLIYDPQVIHDGFRKLKSFDVAAILDNSGSHPLFPADENRGVRMRIAPYLCFIKKEWFMKNEFDFTPVSGEYDSMGKITQQMVEQGKRIYEFEDDRNTFRMNEENHDKFDRDTWLDGPGFKWSEPSDKEKKLGYYHIRNISTAISLLNEYHSDQEAYKRRKNLMPFSEVIRLLAWQWIYDKYALQLYHKYIKEFEPVLGDYGISTDEWKNYIITFEEYHKWIKEI